MDTPLSDCRVNNVLIKSQCKYYTVTAINLGSSDSNSHSIIFLSDLAVCVHIDHILTMLCR